MWIVLAISLAFSCDLDAFEYCLGNGKRATNCISSSKCVEKEIEIKVYPNKLIIKGFVVSTDDKFEIGELIGCDLTSYELCFSLPEKEVVSCLKKIECIEFIIISELREENFYFDFANYNQYTKDSDATNLINEQTNQDNPTDIFSEYNYVWAKLQEEKNKDIENEGDQDAHFEELDSLDFDESGEIDSFDLIESQEDDELDENIESDDLEGEHVQEKKLVNDKDHMNQDSDKFFIDLWKIEQEIVDKEKKGKGSSKSHLDKLTLSEIGDKIQIVYDEWEKAKAAKGPERLEYHWMMNEQGEIKELDVLLEDLYIVYRKKLHEMMQVSEHIEGKTEVPAKDKNPQKNSKKNNENQAENSEKSSESLSDIKRTFKNKENTQIKNTEKYSESPQDAVMDLFNKESEYQEFNKINEEDNLIDENEEDEEEEEEEEEDDEEEEEKDEDEDDEEEKDEDEEEKDKDEEEELDTTRGTHKIKEENNFVDEEELGTNQEDIEEFNKKTVDFVNENESGLEPDINEENETDQNDEDQIFDLEEEKAEDKIKQFTIETDDDSYLSSESNKGFLRAKAQDSDSCEKSCESRCSSAKNDECLSTCLSSICSVPSNRSDYLTVILTGLFLFCIVSIIYLFMKNRNIRIGNQDYIKGHTS